jgi:H+/gluconate symporter-like permease
MIGIILGLILLMYLCYRGYSVIVVAPVTAAVVALFGGLELLPAYTGPYMEGFVGFAKNFFPIFLLGAVFGKIMDDTGAAQAVAQWVVKLIGKTQACLAVVLGCAVLTYGGVSLFVVVFAMYPLAVSIFREANVSRKLIPGAIGLGSFTFTMTAIPGTPQIQNLIPMNYFGTTSTASPIIGMVAGIFMAVSGVLWLNYRARQLAEAGEVFTEPTSGVTNITDASLLPSALLSLLPLVAVVGSNFAFERVVKGGVYLQSWTGQTMIPALLIGIILTVAFNFARIVDLSKTLNEGASGSVLAIINTSAAVGFGAVVRAVPGFQTLTDAVLGIPGTPLISEAASVTILAGATGSASGGLGIALAALGEKFMATGVNPEHLHRVAAIACGGLDSLPHNGAVLTLLAVCAMTHKDSYKDIAVCTVAIPLVATALAIAMATVGIV